MSRALIVVDVQNDFCEGGALAVKGGAKVAADITKWIDANHPAYSLIVASRDAHAAPPNDNCGHFALDSSQPDYSTSWPVHCVKDSLGYQFHPDFNDTWCDIVVDKGYGLQSYSAFEGSTKNGATLLGWLRSCDITEVEIVGLALDYCVMETALDAKSLGYEVMIRLPLTAAVHSAPVNIHETIEKLFEAGVYVANS